MWCVLKMRLVLSGSVAHLVKKQGACEGYLIQGLHAAALSHMATLSYVCVAAAASFRSSSQPRE